MFSRSIASLLLCPAFVLACTGGLSTDLPLFSVRFNQKSVTLTGKVDSPETAAALSAAVESARPDLVVSSEAMSIDPSSPFSRLGDIKSLLAEIGLSTHEGLFEIWPDRIVVGGLTDSPVTITALKIRVEPVLEGRSLINRICIVGSDELPKPDVSLAGGNASEQPAEAVNQPATGPAFEVPGILVEKLFPVIFMLNNFALLEGKTGDAIRATPLEKPAGPGATEEGGPDTNSPPMTPQLTATPVQEYEVLPSIRFSRNASILQSNQTSILDELAKRLLSPDRAGAPVLLEAVIPASGSAALNDYLAERRGTELVRLLQERGLDPGLLKTGVVKSLSTVDDGEVRLRVEILPPPDPPLAPANSSAATGSSPPPSNSPTLETRDP